LTENSSFANYTDRLSNRHLVKKERKQGKIRVVKKYPAKMTEPDEFPVKQEKAASIPKKYCNG